MNKILKRDLLAVCYHEAGHVVVARHFKLDAAAMIYPNETGNLKEDKGFRGQTRYMRTSPFREAVIAWAGFLSERIPTDPIALEPLEDYGAVLSEDGGIDWWSVELEWGVCISATDRAELCGHPQVWRAYEVSRKILVRRRKELEGTARDLIRSQL